MRCKAYCNAKQYNINELVQYLLDCGYEPQYFGNVIHIKKELYEKGTEVDVFFFHFGCVCIWDALSDNEEKEILQEVQKFSINPLKDVEMDILYYKYIPDANKTYIDEENNEMIINSDSTNVKLSISYALAQSVKLATLEHSVVQLLEKTTPIQEELVSTGRVSLSKKEISKKIGGLFGERYSISMHSEVLDRPEFFWKRPSCEPIYLLVVAFQDIQQRQNLLNHRLNIIHELYSLLSNELNYIHSSRIEIVIVILIGLEVAMGFLHTEVFTKFLSLFGR